MGELGEGRLISSRVSGSFCSTDPFIVSESGLLTVNQRKALSLITSISLAVVMSLYNSLIFNKNRYNIGLPLFAAIIYDTTQYMLAVLLICLLRKKEDPTVWQLIWSCPRSYFMRFMVPCGTAAALNVALSNSSLQFVSLSFYTMVKSSSLMFLLVFAFMFRLEKPNLQLVGVIMIVGFGLGIAVYNPSRFEWRGFSLVFCSAIVSGFRWTLTQLIVHRSRSRELEEEEKLANINGFGPLAIIIHLGPVITVALVAFSLIFEGPSAIAGSVFFASKEKFIETFMVCFCGGVQSFLVIVLEYHCVKETSVLTLSVTSVVKELLIIGIAVFLFEDELKPFNFVGALISIVGVLLYTKYKMQQSKSPLPLTPSDRQRLYLEESAMQNLYVAAPAAEGTWMLDPLCANSEVSHHPGYNRVRSYSFRDSIERWPTGNMEFGLRRTVSTLDLSLLNGEFTNESESAFF